MTQVVGYLVLAVVAAAVAYALRREARLAPRAEWRDRCDRLRKIQAQHNDPKLLPFSQSIRAGVRLVVKR